MRIRLFRSLSLRQRVFGFMALLAVLPVACFAMTTYSMVRAREVEKAVHMAAAGVLALERINSNVFAIVMESRGLYLSNKVPEGAPFAKNMDRYLGQLAHAVEEWKSNAIPSERDRIAKLGKSVDGFNELRRELIALAAEGKFDEIRAKGNNQTNRAIRSALNEQVTALGKSYLAYEKEAEELKHDLAESNRRLLMGLVAISLLICTTGAVVLNRTVLQLFARMRVAMMALAAGDLEAEFEGTNRADEIGDFARAFKAFKDGGINEKRLAQETAEKQKLIDAERERVARDQAERQKRLDFALSAIGGGLKQLADGRVAVQIDVDLAPELSRLKGDFNATAARLRSIVGEVQEGSAAISHNAEEISRASDTLSRRTEQQAASLEQTASALSQLSEKVSGTAVTCAHAHAIVEKARATTEAAAEIVARAIHSVGGIEKSSTEIGNITAVIDEIAFQTNLLALNAGVEAARAGDSGRGFAVVASEVRALAQRSAAAAKEIKDLVASSSRQVREGVALVGDTGKALTAIREHVRDSTNEIVSIAASAKEQASGIAELNGAVQQLDKATQDNAAMAEETNAAGRALKDKSHDLVVLVSQFDLGVRARSALAA